MISRYSRPEMADIWSDESRFKLWLEIETLALERMVQLGIAPASALESVKKRANFSTERTLEIEKEVKHDVIAFLTNVAEHVGPDSRYLHLGMTSSDVLDTAFAVQLCRATDMILADLRKLLEVVKRRALEHRDTPCVGRSHGIHAEPTTFGLKVASWYAELVRREARIVEARKIIAVGAISGAVGTYAGIDPSVEAHVCKNLGLEPELVSTQVISRDRHATLFMSFAELASSLERICVEIRHLQRTEVREAEENFTKGQKGSSAMPHKRNPILSENVTGIARLVRSLAMSSLENVALWHERDISHSSVERVIAPDITIVLDFALNRMVGLIDKLVVYPENMKRNLELTNGLVYSGSVLIALAAKGLTREDAYKLVQQHAMATWDALSTGDGKKAVGLEERVRKDPQILSILSQKELDDCFSLEKHLSHSAYIFKRVFGS